MQIISLINEFLSGPIMVMLVVIVGIVMTYKTGFIQLVQLPSILIGTIKSMFQKREKGKDLGITPFQAVTTALSGTIGTGNIVGVAAAISIGGVGAIFWMWVSAFFGMATKYAEILLSIKYRKKVLGSYIGGPMYYIEATIGKWLAVIFALLCLLCSFGIGNMVQANAISGALGQIMPVDIRIVMIIIATMIGFVIIGGIRRIAKITESLIPAMSLFYIVGCLIVVIMNYQNFFNIITLIFKEAFNFNAVAGGSSGYIILNAIKVGFARGVFTNEAGLGSAPIAHAAAEVESSSKQGKLGIFEVFFDTFVMCSLTAFVIINSNMYENLSGAELTLTAFKLYLGDYAAVFIAISTAVFAISTIIGWNYYGEVSIKYLTNRKIFVIIYKVAFIIAVYVGAMSTLDMVWGLADLFNGLMMIPNMIVLVLLANVVRDETNTKRRKKSRVNDK